MCTIRKIFYSICVVFVVTLGGCAHVEVPALPQDEYVPIRLVALTSGVEVTRAGIDPSATDIESATIIVFDGTEDKVLQCRHLTDVATEQIYLKAGDTYRVFAVANLGDGNCPNGDAATYFDDVAEIADLDEKYFISTVAAGAAPTLMPMTSVDNSDATSSLATVTIQHPLLPPAVGVESTVTIKMRSIYTKVVVTIYNRTSRWGANQSGLTFSSYLTENLPQGSWIVERPLADVVYDSETETWSENATAAGDDYPQTLTPLWTGYAASGLTDISTGWSTTPIQIGANYYVSRSFDVYTLENRRGIVAGVSAHQRKEKAPQYALQLTAIGTLNNKTFYTYVLVGKGRVPETPPDWWYGNYNVDRNCIYHVNLYVNSINNIEQDTRREYLDVVVVQNDLVSPTPDTIIDF
jgi:hypothetical protein